MSLIKYAATCLFGLERLVGEEIDALGYKRIETIDGRVYFEGDESAIARFNIFSRFAERLFILMGQFKASSFEELFEGTKKIPLENYIDKDDAFPVKGHSIKSALFSIPDCQKIVKKAAVERLKMKNSVSWFNETGEKKQIEFFILNNRADIMLDTTGTGLFKRGYRLDAVEAPIRETLAAALVKLSRPRRDVLLWDPFCGSGTIPIEAALQLSNTAPGISREFAAQKFGFVDSSLFEKARQEAHDIISHEPFEIYGSDISDSAISTSIGNARRAGIAKKNLSFFRMDMKDIDGKGRRGTIVCNPPYGERMLEKSSAQALYAEMGKAFAKVPSWQVYVITSQEGFERFYGKRADNVRKMYNGMLRCYYYQYFKKPIVK